MTGFSVRIPVPAPQVQRIPPIPTAEDVLGGGQIPFHILRGQFRDAQQSIQLQTAEHCGIPGDT